MDGSHSFPPSQLREIRILNRGEYPLQRKKKGYYSEKTRPVLCVWVSIHPKRGRKATHRGKLESSFFLDGLIGHSTDSIVEEEVITMKKNLRI